MHTNFQLAGIYKKLFSIAKFPVVIDINTMKNLG